MKNKLEIYILSKIPFECFVKFKIDADQAKDIIIQK
jgi:hypothetical protein